LGFPKAEAETAIQKQFIEELLKGIITRFNT
jgi:hypothetical protein